MNYILSKSRMVAWTMWMIASIFYAYQYVLRVMPNIMIDDIMQKFHIGAVTFGQFSGIYYIGYALMHVPIGILLDRFGPKKIMPLCMLLTVVGLLPLILAEHWAYPILGRILIGMGSSGAILGVFKIIRITFSEIRFPRMLSFSVTIGLLGAIYGGGPVNYMHVHLGFQAVVVLFACAGALLALTTYWMIPEIESQPTTTIFSDIKEVIRNKKVVWACICAGLMVGPLEGFADVWAAGFLKHVYGFEETLAASLTSFIFIGMCFGAPVLSYVAEKVGHLKAIMGAGLLMALSFVVLMFSYVSSSVLSMSFILVGICSAYQILAIYKSSTWVRKEIVGLTTAMANMIIMLFGYGFHSVIGYIVGYFGGAHDAKALSLGIIVIPVALCVGSVGFLIIYIVEKMGTKKIIDFS